MMVSVEMVPCHVQEFAVHPLDHKEMQVAEFGCMEHFAGRCHCECLFQHFPVQTHLPVSISLMLYN